MNTTTSGQAGEECFSVSVPSPFGPLRVVATEDAVVGLYHEDHDPPPDPGLLGRPVGTTVDTVTVEEHRRPDDAAGTQDRGAVREERTDGMDRGDRVVVPAPVEELLIRVAAQLKEYLAGGRTAFDLPLVPRGTAFQQRVWSALAEIPYGERRSYGQIASALGNPSMGRAVGAAVRSNPISLIIPGHRVVSRSGAVVGYAAGPAVKEALLDLESGRSPDRDQDDPGDSGDPGGAGMATK
ncbi:hypothetical protein AC792_11120 [Arthrobacter sp. RIT-PI-e]|uniref:methylated-DNA--[protein]-cysteine S-methyltransferase n=1 Tax=Arthrobacter sp. RIT-PI-e TaxID=1681197 RepID=UPI0006768E91|nr:methylated-DNA--[protein]-cysteine S-methyltransferase [Arthrobacter sp. RIT-PI-e]KNC18607.1 hypothetical protein AC792_11120 [Arthrobacter sp. RIT-PI-e]